MVGVDPATGEEINIQIRLDADASGASRAVEGFNEELRTMVHQVRRASSPYRLLSRDIWSFAYALRRMSTALGISNPLVEGLYSGLVAIAAALRMVLILQGFVDLLRMLRSASLLAAAAQWVHNAALAQGAFWINMIGWGVPALLAAATFAGAMAYSSYTQSQVPRMQMGGDILRSGLIYAHAGETVVPEGSSYNWINVSMSTGPISSEVDVENMLGEMGSRLATQSRRRSGH